MIGEMKDITGNVYGLLTVVTFLEDRSGKGEILWKCKCECGKEKITKNRLLQQGRVRSCGCLKKQSIIQENQPYRRKYTDYKTDAKVHKREFNLTFDQFFSLVTKLCTYCGEMDSKISRHGVEYKSNGLDRVDSSKGYVETNVVPCCAKCNRMKRNYTLEEFKEQVTRIYENFNNSTKPIF